MSISSEEDAVWFLAAGYASASSVDKEEQFTKSQEYYDRVDKEERFIFGAAGAAHLSRSSKQAPGMGAQGQDFESTIPLLIGKNKLTVNQADH